MTPDTQQQQAAPRRRVAVRAAPVKTPRRTKRWQNVQDEMVSRYADHAIEGGRTVVGVTADPEKAIDAYLEKLRDDLLAFAIRGG